MLSARRTGLFAAAIGLALVLIGCHAGDDPRFRLLRSADSGIDFVNRVEDTAELNIINYLYFYDGGGVAVGDVNGDSLPDVYFTANQGPNRLYINQGNLQFEDVTDAAGVSGSSDWQTGVTMADVNADGLLDIYVSAVDSVAGLAGRNELFINNGDGTFSERAEEVGLAHRGYGTQAAFFDYDLDGDLDAFLLNHSTHGERTFGHSDARLERHPRAGDRLLRNDDGRFVDVSREANIYGGPVGYGLGVSISDLNADGRPDIYVANDFHENDYLYINNGDGTFADHIRDAVPHNSRSSMGSDAADVNNDGLPDVVVLDMLPFREDILKTSASAESREIAETRRAYGYHHQFEQNTLLLNRGAGRFSDVAFYAGIEATDWSWAALLCDLDNDGWKDLFVTNGIWRRPNDEDYLNLVSSAAAQDSLERYPESALRYIELMPQVAIPNFAFRNNADLTFRDATSDWGLAQEQFSNGAAYADLDNDGDLDLVVNNLNAPAAVYENTGGGNFLSVRLDGPAGNTWGIGAAVYLWSGDTAQVQENFPTRGFQSSVDPRLHFGLGGASTVDSLVVVWPDGRFESHRAVDANRRLVLRYADASGRYQRIQMRPERRIFADADLSAEYRHRENAYQDFTREPLMPHKVSTEGPALAVGDVNGDGLDDLFAGGAKWQAATLLIQTPEGALQASNQELWKADSLFEDVDAAFFDADNDGDLDLYVVSAGNEWWGEADALRDRLYVNDGAGSFSRGELPDFFENGSVVRPADFDADGDVDLFIGGRVVAKAYGTSPRSYLLRNDGGRFVDATPEILMHPGMITDAVWSDVDADGTLDLALVGEWMSPHVYFGGANGFEAVAFGPRGWWTAIASADVNADGQIDLVLGNLGLNSRLRASQTEPVQLYTADFDSDGEDDHVLTSFRNGVSYPLADRDALLEAIPSLGRLFPTYDAFGASRMTDIFSEEKLREARILRVDEFASMLALGSGDRQFELRRLPAQAQFAPVQAILAEDFDGDGIVDLLLGENFYGVAPARGRYDAGYGTLLRGLGDGTFEALEPRESGLWLRGEIRRLARLQGAHGQAMIVAARNNDSLQFALNQMAAGPNSEPVLADRER